jgi:actin-related protein 6
LANVQEAYDQIIFETFEFNAYSRLTAPHWAAANSLDVLFNEKTSSKTRDCILILDTGYSFTHAVPFLRQHAMKSAIKR